MKENDCYFLYLGYVLEDEPRKAWRRYKNDVPILMGKFSFLNFEIVCVARVVFESRYIYHHESSIPSDANPSVNENVQWTASRISREINGTATWKLVDIFICFQLASFCIFISPDFDLECWDMLQICSPLFSVRRSFIPFIWLIKYWSLSSSSNRSMSPNFRLRY